MDIVERLRARNVPYGWPALADSAAAEIERLRAENTNLRAALDKALDLIKERIRPYGLTQGQVANDAFNIKQRVKEIRDAAQQSEGGT